MNPSEIKKQIENAKNVADTLNSMEVIVNQVLEAEKRLPELQSQLKSLEKEIAEKRQTTSELSAKIARESALAKSSRINFAAEMENLRIERKKAKEDYISGMDQKINELEDTFNQTKEVLNKEIENLQFQRESEQKKLDGVKTTLKQLQNQLAK